MSNEVDGRGRVSELKAAMALGAETCPERKYMAFLVNMLCHAEWRRMYGRERIVVTPVVLTSVQLQLTRKTEEPGTNLEIFFPSRWVWSGSKGLLWHSLAAVACPLPMPTAERLKETRRTWARYRFNVNTGQGKTKHQLPRRCAR